MRTLTRDYIASGCVGSGWVVCCMGWGSMEYCGADEYWTRNPQSIGRPFESEHEALRFIDREHQRREER